MRSRSELTPSSRRLRHWAGGMAAPSQPGDPSVPPTGGWVPDWDLLPGTTADRELTHRSSARPDRLVRRRRRSGRWVTPGGARHRTDGLEHSWSGAEPTTSDDWTEEGDWPEEDDWPAADDPDPDDSDETGAVVAGLERRTRGRGLVPPEERWRAVRERGDRWTERWLPAPWVSARRRISGRAAVLLTVVAVVGVLVAGWTWWSARPAATPLAVTGPAPDGGDGASVIASASAPGEPAVAPTVTRADPALTVPTAATATAPVEIWVSVTGRVHDPGLVRLPVGARVADALAAAGGLVDERDLVGINLAQVLVDGQSVVVADQGTSVSPVASGGSGSDTGYTATGPGGPGGGPLDLNSADQAALEGLPGVGPVTAEAILRWRTEHGPFTTVEQLREIPGIGPARFERLVAEVTVG